MAEKMINLLSEGQLQNVVDNTSMQKITAQEYAQKIEQEAREEKSRKRKLFYPMPKERDANGKWQYKNVIFVEKGLYVLYSKRALADSALQSLKPWWFDEYMKLIAQGLSSTQILSLIGKPKVIWAGHIYVEESVAFVKEGYELSPEETIKMKRKNFKIVYWDEKPPIHSEMEVSEKERALYLKNKRMSDYI